MAKNNRGGVKSAQVNTGIDSAVEMATALTQTHSSMDRNHQVDTIKMLHETFRMDPNAAEHTGFDVSTIEKINHFSALGMVAIASLECMYGTSDFALTMRKSDLATIQEAANELGIKIGEAKLLENKTEDGESVVEVKSEDIMVPENVKTKLKEDKAAVDATKGKVYDPTKIKNDDEFKEALTGLLSISSDGKLIDNIYKAISFYLAYKKVIAHRTISSNEEILKNTKDAEYKKKVQKLIDDAKADIKNLNSMSNTDAFRKIVEITGHTGLLLYGFASHLSLVTKQTGSPISAWCELYASSIDRKTGESKYSYEDIANIVKCLVEFNANRIINEANEKIQEENKLPEKDRVQSHIDTANKNIEYAKKSIEAIKCAPSDFVVSLKENYINNSSKEHNKAHKTVISIKNAFYRNIPAEKMYTVKMDSFLNCCTQYAGIVSNLFRDPLNQLDGYSMDLTDKLEFKTPDEISEERLAAEKAAAEAAAKKAEEDAAKKEAALKAKEEEAKKKKKEASKTAKKEEKAAKKEEKGQKVKK